LGLKLKEDIKLVTQRIIELGDKKKTVTEEPPYIISDVLHSKIFEEKIVVGLTYYHTKECVLQHISLQLMVVN
jgi:hypothetical protein